MPLHSPCACVAARCVLAVSEINFCQPQRTLRYTKETLVRDHSFNFWCVCIAHQNRLAEFLFSLLRLRGQDVAQMRMSALYFSGCCFLKPLRGAFMGLQLRHISSGEPSIFRSQFSVLSAKSLSSRLLHGGLRLLSGVFLGGENRMQRIAFLPRTKFYDALVLHVFYQTFQNLTA